jgi:2-polyprenyl-6-methoxyphenol hydroxylase-like FAD-dependent oxidoreductase
MVIGGGIVGLTTGLALRRVGFDVTVYERAPEVRSAGAAFGLWRNALRVFDVLGILEAVNAVGKPAEMYFHDPSGRLMNPPNFDTEDHQYLLVNRAQLTDFLADAFGRDGIRLGAHFQQYEETPSEVVAPEQMDRTGDRRSRGRGAVAATGLGAAQSGSVRHLWLGSAPLSTSERWRHAWPRGRRHDRPGRPPAGRRAVCHRTMACLSCMRVLPHRSAPVV